MVTRNEKIKKLLECDNREVIISPYAAEEKEFGAIYEGMRGDYFQFVDGDGDFWDCSGEEIDSIILKSGNEIEISNIKDDEIAEWQESDIDAGQYFKKIGEHRFLYKENRICAVTGETFVYESEMDLSDYDEDEIENKVSAYYGSLSELKKTCGVDWEQIALECIFEQELSEREEGFYEGPKSEIFGLKEAVEAVSKINGSGTAPTPR